MFKKTILSLALAVICAQAFATGSGGGGGGSGSGGAGAPSSSSSGSSSGVDVRLGDVIAESGDSSAGARVEGVSAQSGDSVASSRSGDSLSSAKSGDSNSKAIVGDTKATGGKSDSTSKAIVGDTKATGGKSDSKAIVGDTKATGGKSDSTSQSKATGGKSTSDSTSGAISGSKSGDVITDIKAGDVAVDNVAAGGMGGAGGQGGAGGSAAGGSGGKIEQTTKYFNVTFPEPVNATAIAAGNCGASFSVAAGWNFFSLANTNSNSSPECRIMPQIAALFNNCQYATGYQVLHEITRQTLIDATSGLFKKGTDIGTYVAVAGVTNHAQCDRGVPQSTRVYTEAELDALLARGAKPTSVTIYNDARAQAAGGDSKAEANDTREEAVGQCQQTGQISAIIAGKPYKAPAKKGGCPDPTKK